MATQANRSIVDRMIGAARLDVHTFEEVEADTSATRQALMVVVTVALATGVASITTLGIGGLLSGVMVGLVGWALWAWIVYFIGTRFLATSETHADWGQLARALGFAQSPGVLKVLAALPFIGGLIFILVSFWQFVAMVTAVRQALDYESTWRAVGVVVLGFIPYAILVSIAYNLLGA